MPHIIVNDEAFALTENIRRPNPNKINMTGQRLVFNYRLSRARRVRLNGRLANKWRVFHRALDVKLEFCDAIVKACCILHNFVLRHEGVNLEDTLYECQMPAIDRVECNMRESRKKSPCRILYKSSRSCSMTVQNVDAYQDK